MIGDEEWSPSHLIATESSQFLVRPTWPSGSPPPRSSSSPIPPPLPKRPELRQRSPDMTSAPPPMFSKERFEGVRQKWEKVDSQYVRQRSHDSLDEGYRSREAAEADYRRQLSRESLLRSLSRSKTGSRDSLDRWVENGVRSRSMWRKLEEEVDYVPGGSSSSNNNREPKILAFTNHHSADKVKNGKKSGTQDNFYVREGKGMKSSGHPSCPALNTGSNPINNRMGLDNRRRDAKIAHYRELDDSQRFPGLDKDTARVTLHSSNLNLSQHIYSEPNFEAVHSQPQQSKSKRFSFAFWK